MIIVLDGWVPAIGTMGVIVVCVSFTIFSFCLPHVPSPIACVRLVLQASILIEVRALGQGYAKLDVPTPYWEFKKDPAPSVRTGAAAGVMKSATEILR